MVNGLAKLSFLTTAGGGTLRELTTVSGGDAGPPPLEVLLAALRTWSCVLLGRTHFK